MADIPAAEIPYLTTLRQRLWKRELAQRKSSSGNEFTRLDRELEQLPYCLAAAFDGVLQLASAQERALSGLLLDGKLASGVTYIFPEALREQVSFPFDTFLSAARRCQNALIPYMNSTLLLVDESFKGRQLERSLSDVMKKIRAGTLKLPSPDLDQVLRQYWEDSGARLKNYRDLSQHCAVVASDARATLDDGGAPSIYLVIPNNPEMNSAGAGALAYADPIVHALPYAVHAYRELYRAVFLVSVILLDGLGEISLDPRSLSLTPKVPFGGSQSFHRPISPVAIGAGVHRLRQGITEEVARTLAAAKERERAQGGSEA